MKTSVGAFLSIVLVYRRLCGIKYKTNCFFSVHIVIWFLLIF